MRTMVLLDAALGLRVSELLALKLEDINLEKRWIKVRRKLTRGKLGKTRSVTSDATLPLADALIDAPIAWKPETSGGIADVTVR